MHSAVRALLVTCIVSLEGCGMSPVANRTLRIDPRDENGWAIVSFTQPPGVPLVYWLVRPVPNPARESLEIHLASWSWAVRSGDATLHPLELREGDYEFYFWSYPRSDGHGSYYVQSQPFSIRFHVRGGRATYLGHLSLQLRPVGGLDGMATYRLEVQDRSSTDVAMFLQGYPYITADQVIVDLMQDGGPLDAR